MEEKLNALIVDDEAGARKLMTKLLEETLYFSEIRESPSAARAREQLENFEPDIIFLDIKMPGEDGFTFVSELKGNEFYPEIVFVTAFDEYAIKAIKSQAFDYLLKPVNRKELKQCVMRFVEQRSKGKEQVGSSKAIKSPEKISRIRVNTRTGTLFINPAIIMYCKADGNYTTICTGEKLHLCTMNLGKIKSLLSGNEFIRIGRSYILNFEFITMLDRKDSTVTMIRNGETATIKIPRHHLKDIDLM